MSYFGVQLRYTNCFAAFVFGLAVFCFVAGFLRVQLHDDPRRCSAVEGVWWAYRAPHSGMFWVKGYNRAVVHSSCKLRADFLVINDKQYT